MTRPIIPLVNTEYRKTIINWKNVNFKRQLVLEEKMAANLWNVNNGFSNQLGERRGSWLVIVYIFF